jgi:hypothetical protein
LRIAASSALTVLNNHDSGPGSLRDTIAAAQSGDTIVFAPSLRHSTITLTSGELGISKDLAVKGLGANWLAISGNHASRIFDLSAGVSLTVAGLTLTEGFADGVNGDDVTGGGGGAILNQGGSLTLAHDLFTSNQAFPHGGAVANYPTSTFQATDCTFLGNQTVGKPGSDWVEGGAIWDSGGPGDPNSGVTGTVIGCTFIANQAIGGNGGVSTNDHALIGSALGGALHNDGASTLTVENSTFIGNQAIGGNGASAGLNVGLFGIDVGAGGAITNDEGKLLVVRGCTFADNQARGGSNASSTDSSFGVLGDGRGGALSTNGGAMTLTDNTFFGNEARGGNNNTGGSGALLVGVGDGGAIVSDAFGGVFGSPQSLTIDHCTFANNQAVGGFGNASNTAGVFVGDGIGGGFENFNGATATIRNSTFDHNQAIGSQGVAGGNGSDGLGGAVANQLGSTVSLSNCTVVHNRAVGGEGEDGGNGLGGGLYNDGSTASGVSSVTVTGSTITHNRADGGAGSEGGSAGLGIGGGVYFASGGSVCLDRYTVSNIDGNTASTSNDDAFGDFTIC